MGSIGSKEAAAVERLGLVGLGSWLVCEEPVLVVSALLSSQVGIHEELKFLLNRVSGEASQHYTSRLGRNLELFTCLGIGADLECKTKNKKENTKTNKKVAKKRGRGGDALPVSPPPPAVRSDWGTSGVGTEFVDAADAVVDNAIAAFKLQQTSGGASSGGNSGSQSSTEDEHQCLALKSPMRSLQTQLFAPFSDGEKR